MASQRYAGVEVLRLIASGMVLVTHALYYASGRLDASVPQWNEGTSGINIFFVISGFVMVFASRRSDGSLVGWQAFASRRAIRILPMYWLATTANLAILLALPALVLHSTLDWTEIVKSYFLVPGVNTEGRVEPLLGVGWTLYFESFFYVLFAFVLATRKDPFVPVVATLGVCAIVSLFRTSEWPPATIYFSREVLDFLFGMLIAKWAARSSMPLLAALGLVAVGATVLVFGGVLSEFAHPLWYRSVPAALLVAGVVFLEPHFNFGRFRFLIFMGGASYVLYLFHPLTAPGTMVILGKMGITNPAISIFASILVSLAAAAAIYKFADYPLHKWLLSRIKASETKSIILADRRRAVAIDR